MAAPPSMQTPNEGRQAQNGLSHRTSSLAHQDALSRSTQSFRASLQRLASHMCYNYAMHVLLQTKLFRPALAAVLVRRPRLERLFAAEALPRLTLVAAPAGSGKTTLVAMWLQQHPATAWLALDDHDNQLDQFLAYLIAALQTAAPTVGHAAHAMLQAGPQRDPGAVIGALINDLAARAAPLVVVLDDYHVIAERAIHDALALLLDRAPPHFHVVLITRHDPPLPLARWRVRDQLAELRAADLRFTHEEAAQFLATTMRLDVSDAAMHTLEQRTEGWIAGLQLAALSLRGRPDAEQLIAHFGGSDRLVADYLVEEVLGQQPADMRLFLLCTAVLQRFTAGLCHALLAGLAPVRDAGMDSAVGACQARIEALDGANLFIVPLDQQRIWYRYHQLFADLLRLRLRRDYPALWPELHRRAGHWHEQADELDAAMQYARAIHDDKRAMDIIEQHGLRLVSDGFVGTLLGWMRHIPDEQLRQRPLLCVVCGWACVLSQQVGRAEQFIAAGAQQVAGYAPVTLARDGALFSPEELVAHLASLRAFAASSRGQIAQTIALAQAALDSLPTHVGILHSPLFQLLGEAYARTGQFEQAQHALHQATDSALAGANRHVAISARAMLGDLLTSTGDVVDAQRVYLAAVAVGSPPEIAYTLPPLVYPLLGLAWIHFRWNDLAAMEAYLAQVEALAQQGGLVSILLWVALLRARRDTVAQQFAQVALWIEQADALITQHPRLEQNRFDLAIARGRLALQQGQLATAAQQVQQCGGAAMAFREQDVRAAAGYQFFTQHQDFLPFWGQLLVAQQQFADAHALATWLADAAAATRCVVVGVQAAMLVALAYAAQQQPARAQAALAAALALAAPRNLQRVLIEFGPPVGGLLRAALPYADCAPFVQQVLAAPELAGPLRDTTAAAQLPEPLTERETQIIRLLAAGLNSTEIAAQLIIAPSTVRSYIKSLYSKLSVNRRHDAIERARALHLV